MQKSESDTRRFATRLGGVVTATHYLSLEEKYRKKYEGRLLAAIGHVGTRYVIQKSHIKMIREETGWVGLPDESPCLFSGGSKSYQVSSVPYLSPTSQRVYVKVDFG